MATLDDVLARLDALERQQAQALRGLALLCRHLGAVAQPAGASSGAAAQVAPDSELDGPKGDPEVRRDPPRWKGDPMAPRRMSQGSADWLDCVAEFLQFKADNPREGKQQYAKYDALDAARARGWAARLRAGWKPPHDPSDSWGDAAPPAGEEDFA